MFIEPARLFIDRVLIRYIFRCSEHPDNTKAYFRRSKARQAMSLFHEALEDLEAMVEIDPSLRNEAKREKAILIKKAKEASKKQKKEFRSFFKNEHI